jgi:probable HAF family extracellular repeat protein
MKTTISKISMIVATLALALTASTNLALADVITYIDYPGACTTQISGINNNGDIVGFAQLPGSPTANHGFLYSGGVFSSFDYPGAIATGVNGYGAYGDINDNGDIVGQATLGNGDSIGYLFSGGTFFPIQFPGAAYTVAAGINDLGEIVGSYSNDPSNIGYSSGFIFKDGVYSTFDIAGAGGTLLTGINDSGQIVGFVNDQSGLFAGSFVDTPSVPEPSSLALLASAAAALALVKWRFAKKLRGGA